MAKRKIQKSIVPREFTATRVSYLALSHSPEEGEIYISECSRRELVALVERKETTRMETLCRITSMNILRTGYEIDNRIGIECIYPRDSKMIILGFKPNKEYREADRKLRRAGL